MKTYLLIFIYGLFLATWAHAEGTRGGQNAVVCFNDSAIPGAFRDVHSSRFGLILDDEVKNNVVSVQSLDLFEALIPRGLDQTPPKVVDIGNRESVRAYVERIAARFEHSIPVISTAIRLGTSTFDDQHILVRPSGLKRVYDENDVGYIDPVHCVIATMAVQYEAGQITFLQLDSRLYNHPSHTHLSQAVLFLHEALYWIARNNNQLDSRNTRAVVGALINELPSDSIQLLKLWRNLGFPSALSRNGMKSGPSYLVDQLSPFITQFVSGQLAPLVAQNQAGQDVAAKFKVWASNWYKNGLGEGIAKAFNAAHDHEEICGMPGLGSHYDPTKDPYLEQRAWYQCRKGINDIYQSYLLVRTDLLNSSQEYLERDFQQTIYPAVDGMTQLSANSREQVKSILRKAKDTSAILDPDFVSEINPAFHFQFSKHHDWQTALENVSVTIP